MTTEVTFVDDYTFTVKFAMPYGSFINNEFRLSWNSWPNWFAPSHFLKLYHTDFTDIAEILPAMEERGFPEEDQWVNFYTSIMATGLGDGGGYVTHPYITTFPVLYAWKAVEVLDDGGIIFDRNPYFFAVDSAGNQLPYIDHLRRQYIADSELMNLDIIAGKTDVQTMFIRISDFPLFKENEANGHYVAIPKRAWQHHVLIYWLNPVVGDPILSAALSELDFRRALSLALDRNQINEAVFLGLGTPAQFAPPAGTALYNEELTNYYAAYDPDQAMQLLEGLGYVDVDGDGFREAPDGSDFLLPITFYEVTPAAIPGAQFAEQYWEAIGIEVDAKELEGQAFWQQQGSNQVAASIWWANGPDFQDGAFISQSVNVREWNVWRSSDGEAGIEPPDWVKRIWQIQQERLVVASEEDRLALDAEGWKLLTENLTIIGTVEGAMNPLVLNADLGNVQYGFDKNFVPQTFLEYSFQWYFTTPERREG
ncbi:MAG: hypothetical protein K8I30_18510 [Anaerolineae bacterium]|nr:hypothetical protein [Anaerolineae bacterium]